MFEEKYLWIHIVLGVLMFFAFGYFVRVVSDCDSSIQKMKTSIDDSEMLNDEGNYISFFAENMEQKNPGASSFVSVWQDWASSDAENMREIDRFLEREHGGTETSAVFPFLDAAIFYRKGRPYLALQNLIRARAAFEKEGRADGVLRCLLFSALIYLRIERIEAADLKLQELELYRATFPTAQMPTGLYHGLHARIALIRGDLDRASYHAEEQWLAFAGKGPSWAQAVSFLQALPFELNEQEVITDHSAALVWAASQSEEACELSNLWEEQPNPGVAVENPYQKAYVELLQTIRKP